MVPKNIHTPPTEGIGNSRVEGGGGGGGGGSGRATNLKQCMKLNWNFRRVGGGGGGHRANPFRGGYGYFLEPHNTETNYIHIEQHLQGLGGGLCNSGNLHVAQN